MKLGLIGAGNMASALARGIGEPVLVADIDAAKAAALAAALGGKAVGSNTELAQRADAVVLCHKPKQLGDVAAEVAGHTDTIVSILAATPTTDLAAAYPGAAIYRFIPNMPVEVRRGVICYVPGPGAEAGPEREILDLMGRAGEVIRLEDEPLIEPAMALMSCGPAFMAFVGQSFAEAGARAWARPGRRDADGGGDDGRHRHVAGRTRLRRGGTARPRGHPGWHHRAGPDHPRGARHARARPRRGRQRRGGHAVTRGDIADYVRTLALVYLVLIFIRIILSWIPRIPYNRVLNGFLKFVTDVTDPYLNLFRRILPPVRIGPGALDLSPIIATFVLIIVSSLVAGLIEG